MKNYRKYQWSKLILALLVPFPCSVSLAQVITSNTLSGFKSAIIADKFKDEDPYHITFYTLSNPMTTLMWPKFIISGNDPDSQTYTFMDYSAEGTVLRIKSLPYITNTYGVKDLHPSLSTQNSMYLNGYFGIGVGSPKERIEVAGNIKLNMVDGMGSSMVFEDDGEIRSYDHKHRIIFDRTSGKLEFMEYGDILFSSGAINGARTEKMTLKANGNLGIGTTFPQERIEVNGNFMFHDNGEIKSYDNNHRIIFDRQHDKLEFMEYGDILFSSGAVKGYRTEKMTLAANGNLGIGVTAPTERLELYGNGFIRGKLRLKPAAGEVGITSNQIGGEKAMELTTADSQELQATRLILNGSKDSSDIQFYTGGRGKESLTMHLEGTSGNLGIGVSAPTERLDVHGNSYIRGSLRLRPAAGEVGITSNQVAGDQAMEFTTNDGQGLQATRLILRGSEDNPDIQFYTGGREHEGITMHLEGTSGNLGLATLSPRDKLDVNGTTRTNGLIINPTQNNYGLVNGTVASISGVMQISPRDAAPAAFNTTEYAKNFLLWVEKGIVTEDLAMVNVKSWSDFVFSPGYELNNIQKVADYIKNHGHLPEMPSEEQIKTEGYSIHGMNRKLLQKIEELTLYIIDQEEKINTQQSRLERLALRMDELEKDKK